MIKNRCIMQSVCVTYTYVYLRPCLRLLLAARRYSPPMTTSGGDEGAAVETQPAMLPDGMGYSPTS